MEGWVQHLYTCSIFLFLVDMNDEQRRKVLKLNQRPPFKINKVNKV